MSGADAVDACGAAAVSPGPLRLSGMFESHLTVGDLERSVSFYRDVIGLSLAWEVPERSAAFFWVGDRGEGLLGLWSLGSTPIRFALHIAFTTRLETVLDACDALRRLGITPLSFFDDEADEPSVIAWMPAAAVYFRDPDGHLIEVIAMLSEAPRPELRVVSWSEWASRPGTC